MEMHTEAAVSSFKKKYQLLARRTTVFAVPRTADTAATVGASRGIGAKDNGGYTAAAVAKLKGHVALSEYLRDLESVQLEPL